MNERIVLRGSASAQKNKRAAQERSQASRTAVPSNGKPSSTFSKSLDLSPSMHKAIVYDADGRVIGEMDSQNRVKR